MGVRAVVRTVVEGERATVVGGSRVGGDTVGNGEEEKGMNVSEEIRRNVKTWVDVHGEMPLKEVV